MISIMLNRKIGLEKVLIGLAGQEENLNGKDN